MTKVLRNWGVDELSDRLFRSRCVREGVDKDGIFTYDEHRQMVLEVKWSLSPNPHYMSRWTIVDEIKTLDELL